MSRVRVIMEEFVEGDLDYSGLQHKLSEELAAGATRGEALHALRALTRGEKLSSAMVGLLRRSIDRQFSTDDTDPFPHIRPSEERAARPSAGDAMETAETELPAMFADEPAGEGPPTEEQGPPTEEQGPSTEEQGLRTAEQGLASEASGPMTGKDTPPPGEEEGGTGQEQALTGAARGAEPQPGDVIAGRYAIEGLIGRGGIGLVYRAVDRCRLEAGLEEPRVALKMLKPDLAGREEARRRLLAEGFRGGDLRHENLVRVLDVGDVDGDCFVAMELLEGDSLRNAILRHSPEGLPADEALRVLAGIGRGLAYLHARGLVHGDFKPGNVFLTPDGCPKLLDFGTAGHTQDREPTLEGGLLPGRTPAYASPEVLGGTWPRASDDVFALGCVACELLSSKHPFGRVQADEAREQRLKPVLPKTVSGARRRTLARALAFDGSRRPVDATAFLAGMGLTEGSRSRGGFVAGALSGLGLGVLLVLAIIHPAGPLATVLGPKVAERTDTTPAATLEVSREEGIATPEPMAAPREVPPPSVDVAGRFVPAEPVAPAESAAESRNDPVDEPPAETGPAPAQEDTPVAKESKPPVPEGPGRLEFANAEYRVTEGTAVVIATVVRRGGSAGKVSFRWRTTGGTATPNADYVATDWQVVEIPGGQDSTRIYVPLVDDGVAEGEETFFLELSEPGGGAVLGTRTRLLVSIADDER